MTKALFGVVFAVSLGTAAWVLADPSAGPVAWDARVLEPTWAPRIRLAGGWFVMGSDDAELERARKACGSDCAADAFAAESRAHRVYVRPFAIDRFEVSNAAHQRCVNAGRCDPPRYGEVEPGPELPVVQLEYREAQTYCQFAGGDLPTEAQWEFAAHGSSQRSYPWGTAWEATKSGGLLAEVAAHPEGRSFFGLLNMAGNVWELVLDQYRAPYDPALPSVDPLADGKSSQTGERVLRGGSWKSPAYQQRARYRAKIREHEARDDVGLRCAYRSP